jgi:regulation of enolase protein 1 (concanavalin A-like superfamily)
MAMGLENHTWLNAPPKHSFEGGALHVETGKETDFWRETFYGFWRDSGHFLHAPVVGDFTAEVTVEGRYEVLYDQAGLMVRLSESHWIKAGIEYTDGIMYFSTVVTNGASDWSLIRIPAAEKVRIRLTRHHEAIRVQYLDVTDNSWKPARLAYFPPTASVDVGIMCCSPQREGFKVTFSDYKVGPSISRDLHC